MNDIDKQIIKQHNKLKNQQHKDVEKYKKLKDDLERLNIISNESIDKFNKHYNENKNIIMKYSKCKN